MNRFLAYVREGFESLWRNRTRSVLSVLGMVIGIASVVSVLGLSRAASGGIEQQIATGGSPGYVISVDQTQDDPEAATLHFRDATQLQTRLSGTISRAIPGYAAQLHGYDVLAHGKKDNVSVGSSDGDFYNAGLTALAGRLLTPDDVASAAHVAIVAKSTAQALFGSPDAAVGQSVNFGGARLQIAGVYDVKGTLFTNLIGDTAYVPYTTMRFFAGDDADYIQYWLVDPTQGVAAMAQVRAALARLHGPNAQYTVRDQAQVTGTFAGVLNVVGLGLTIIGGIALFVAGVGIMNIMLVSVTERTREIGIRKSIGATAGDIGLQFLVESTLLSLIGGAVGATLGAAVVSVGSGSIRAAVGEAPIPWITIVAIAVGFSTAVGIGFGSYPAMRAGRMDPVEALRS